MTFFLIALGGALGATSRFLIASPLNALGAHFFPGTLLVNFLGCFFIGFFWESFPSEREFHFFATGFLGALTTMSTFAGENIRLLDAGKFFSAGGYFFGTAFACLLGITLGRMLGVRVFAS